VIDFKSHRRATGLAKRFVYPTVQAHRFQLVRTQAFGRRDHQIPRTVSWHEEWGDLLSERIGEAARSFAKTNVGAWLMNGESTVPGSSSFMAAGLVLAKIGARTVLSTKVGISATLVPL
jgi:hypothetical protein